jgi:hypothetical protein
VLLLLEKGLRRHDFMKGAHFAATVAEALHQFGQETSIGLPSQLCWALGAAVGLLVVWPLLIPDVRRKIFGWVQTHHARAAEFAVQVATLEICVMLSVLRPVTITTWILSVGCLVSLLKTAVGPESTPPREADYQAKVVSEEA